jgi:putative transposase
VLSKRIVHSTPPGATIVFENLTNIRETSKIGRGKQNKNVETKRKLHSWTFAQLFAFTDYKAQERGIRVERIDPRYTSQTCSRCGHQARTNRHSQSIFHCRSCGYQLNADLNAAYTIREKYRTSPGSGWYICPEWAAVNQPLVSGFGLGTNLRLQAEVVDS